MKQFNRTDYDELYPTTTASQTSYDNFTTGSTATTVQGVVDELFTSVSNGKSAIASAITNKGVSTSSSDSFNTMATNIGSILTGTPRSKSDVTIIGNNATIPSGLYGSQFSIAASELCNSGTKSITANGTGIDVTGYSKVNVNVPGIVPSGTLNITKNGTYDVTNYASVIVDIFPAPSSHTPGDVITWDSKRWLVCHYDSSTNRVYLIAKDIISMTYFGNNVTYVGSSLAAECTRYQTNNMSAAALDMCANVTVEGVTAKVFVPSRNQMSGGFSWFATQANRIAYYNGSINYYWTSTGGSPSWPMAYCVISDGSLSSFAPMTSYGFRPCVCVQL